MNLAFRFSGLVANPLESPCGDQAYNQEIVAAETSGILPVVSVLVGALERNIEYRTFVGLLAPDTCAHDAVADFVDRLTVGCCGCCLIFHDAFWLIGFVVKRAGAGAIY